MPNDLKHSLPGACVSIAVILTCIALLSIAAYSTTNPLPQPNTPSEPPTIVDAAKDFSLFGNVITLETVFPDPTVQALYKETYPPDTMVEEGRADTSYAFELIQQPGMNPKEDAHHVYVVVSYRSGITTVSPGTKDHRKEDTAGRKEERIEFFMPVLGGMYSISVESEMRLPDRVNVPEFDPEPTAKRLRLRYLRSLNKLNKQLPKFQPEAPPPLPDKAAKDLSFFDSIVTLETMFPDPAIRARYKKTPTRGHGYSFAMIRQPGMDDRYSHVISVVWSPAGTFVQGTQISVGPQGDTIDHVARTADGLYDLRVTEVLRLPPGADEPEFDPISTAEELLQHYWRYLDKRLSFFDRIVTPEIVFPDPAERALFEMLPPETLDNGWRAYAFPFIRQPNMDNKDFYLITVVWAPAGTFHPGLGGTGGPRGGIVDRSTRTPDGLYDFRVSLGMLLPSVIAENVPEIDLDSMIERLLLQYSQESNKQQPIRR